MGTGTEKETVRCGKKGKGIWQEEEKEKDRG